MGTVVSTSVGTEYSGLCGDSDFQSRINSILGNHSMGSIRIGFSGHFLEAQYTWQVINTKYIATGQFDNDTPYYAFLADSGDALITVGSSTPNVIMDRDYMMYGTSSNKEGVDRTGRYGINFALVKGYNVSKKSDGNSMLIIGIGSQLMLYDPDAESYDTASSDPRTTDDLYVSSLMKFAVAGPLYSEWNSTIGRNSRKLFAARSSYSAGDELSIGSKYFYHAGNGLLLAKESLTTTS